MSNAPQPGFASQDRMRTVFRVAGLVLLVALLACGFMAVRGIAENIAAEPGMDDDSGFKPFLWWLGVMLLLIPTAVCLRAGFGGAALRYAAGEALPVVKDGATYLSDGQGIAGVGRTVPPAAEDSGAAGAVTGPYCRACGTRNDPDARFCDSCGTSLA